MKTVIVNRWDRSVNKVVTDSIPGGTMTVSGGVVVITTTRSGIPYKYYYPLAIVENTVEYGV